jgi:hypothetical protein
MAFSLMNGLSSLGAGVSAFAGQAGLEQQKATLANQSAVLADQLATTRETGLQASGGVIAAAAAEKAQTATAANVATEQTGANTRNLATIAGTAANTAATEAGAMARTQATINAPPETIKLLRALGVPLPGDAAPASGGAAGGSAALPGPRAGGGVAADGSVVPPLGGASPQTTGSAAGGAVSGAASVSPMDNPLVRKALGFPMAGSEESSRYAIAQDVATDPTTKYLTAGQRAAEVENRMAVAKGTMISPKTIEANATAIANYQTEAITGTGLRAPGAANTMARVMEMNPGYNAGDYPIALRTRESVANGPLGVGITAANTVMQHASEFRENAAALNNGRIPAFNWIGNTVLDATGSPRPLSLQETVSALASEARKVYAGSGGGTQSDLDSWEKNFPVNGSPVQQNTAMKELSVLLRGRLTAVADQINNGTPGQKTKITGLGLLNADAFASYQRLIAPQAPEPLTRQPFIGEVRNGASFTGGDKNAPGNWKPVTAAPVVAPADPAAREVGKSYPLPNGKAGIWRGNGWEVQ